MSSTFAGQLDDVVADAVDDVSVVAHAATHDIVTSAAGEPIVATIAISLSMPPPPEMMLLLPFCSGRDRPGRCRCH